MLITTGDGVLWQTTVTPLNGNQVDYDSLRTNPLSLTGRGNFARGCGLDMLVHENTLFVANDSSKKLQEFALTKECLGEKSKLTPSEQHVSHHQPILTVTQLKRENGAIIATGGKDGYITIWEKSTSNGIQILKQIRGHSAAVVRMCFTQNGDRLVSSSVDGSVAMWDISSSLPKAMTTSKYPAVEDYSQVSVLFKILFGRNNDIRIILQNLNSNNLLSLLFFTFLILF